MKKIVLMLMVTIVLLLASCNKNKGCPHTNFTDVEENRTEPTCTQSGGYYSVCRCLDCGHVVSVMSTGTEKLARSRASFCFSNHREATMKVTYTIYITPETLSTTFCRHLSLKIKAIWHSVSRMKA